MKGRRGLSSQSGHVSAFISVFPQPLRQHVNRANRRHGAPFGIASHFKHNMRNSGVGLHSLVKATAGRIAAHRAHLLEGDFCE